MWWMRRDISGWDSFMVILHLFIICWFAGQFFAHLKSKEETGAWCGVYLIGTLVWVSIYFDHVATAASVK